MAHRNAGIHRTTVGDIAITALNDGMFDAGTGVLVGIDPKEAERLEAAAFRQLPPRITISAFLLEIGDKKILIDTGSAKAFGPAHGFMRPALANLGVQPADISTVLVTHAHIDHVSGLLDDAGGAYFPNAEVVINEAETNFWLNPDIAAAAPDAAKSSFALAANCLAPYKDRTRTLKHGATVMPGVMLQHLPGHTPGHSGWIIASGTDSLLVWGDVVHLPGIQFANPEAGMAFDTDADQARASRRKTFDMAATDRLRVAGMHLDFPCFGHVAKASEGYAFVPDVWVA